MVTTARSRSGQVSVGPDGITARSRRELVLDVLFDGRRIWSLWLHRDGVARGRETFVAWPAGLGRFLDGTTQVSVVVHESGEVLYDEEHAFGGSTERIAVVDRLGNPLATDKSGRLVKTFATRSQEHVAPLLNAVQEVLDALGKAGVEPFLAYGTLLGAVREGGLLGHDSDADLGYVSRHSEPVDVMRESFRLQARLAEMGYETQRYSGAAFKVKVAEADGSIRGLDVFGGFLRDGMLFLMGEIRTPFREEWIYPLGRAALEDRSFPVPAVPDRLLAATYGKQWRTPDPAFHFETPASTYRRLNGWFRGIRPRPPVVGPDLPQPLRARVVGAERSGARRLRRARRRRDVRRHRVWSRGRRAVAGRARRHGVGSRPRAGGLSRRRRGDRRGRADPLPLPQPVRAALGAVDRRAGRALARPADPARSPPRRRADRGGAGQPLPTSPAWRPATAASSIWSSWPAGATTATRPAVHLRARQPQRIVAELERAGATVEHRRILLASAPEAGREADVVPSRICRMVASWDR